MRVVDQGKSDCGRLPQPVDSCPHFASRFCDKGELESKWAEARHRRGNCLGTCNRHRLRTTWWYLPPTALPVDRLELCAQLAACARLEKTGGLEPLTTQELSSLLQR